MKNWFLLSAALVASISVEHTLCAALTGPPCTTGRDDGDRYLHEVNCSMLPDTLSFQYSAFSPASSRNKSCWFPKVYESFWNDASSGDEHEQQQHPVHQATKRTVTVKRASTTTPSNLSPTPEPTGDPTLLTTVHISNEADFALLLPKRPGELISDAESDGNAFCTHGSSDKDCGDRFMQEGFIRAAAIAHADDGSWIQVTGCLDPSKSSLDTSDDGGQFDVRFPNGAQCTFGGYGASFIEQIEPSNSRFCLRCCASPNDQMNCNSHEDRSGCLMTIPGTYSFPALGVDCS